MTGGDVPRVVLEPLPYHRAVVEHLQRRTPAVWRHFAGVRPGADVDAAQRTHLLNTTVELTRASHEPLYAEADAIAAQLGVRAPVELYQGEDTGGLNAALLFHPAAARVIFHGPVQDRLRPGELRALLGHELAHHVFWSIEEGAYETAGNVLRALGGMSAHRNVDNTQRLFALSTEVFADRGALAVAGFEDALACLIKVRTGVQDVVTADFLDQSRRLLEMQGGGSREWTHPEAHLRALALDWFASGEPVADGRVRELLEGPLQLDELDLLRREELSDLTQRVVGAALQPLWMRTDATVGHARQMFDDYAVPDGEHVDAADLARWGDSVRAYLSYVLTDLVVVDPDLEDLALAQVHAVAERMGIEEELERAVNRGTKRTRAAIRAALADRDALLARAAGRPAP